MANKKKHEFEKLTEFDRAMCKLVETPKEKAEKSQKKPSRVKRKEK